MGRACVVQLIDPSADVLPYDHALAGALARRGLDVELVTSRFVHGPRPEPDGYELSESFYRAATRLGGGRPRLRRALKLAEHVPDTLRVRAGAAGADVMHWQWLWLEAVSARLLPRGRPSVLTMHNVIRRGRSGRRLAERMDATIVHTRHGAELLGGGQRVHVIPHGAFEHLTRQPDERPLPPELAAVASRWCSASASCAPTRASTCCVEAFRSLPEAELWIVGRPLGVTLPAADNVRLVPRYVSDAELPGLLPPRRPARAAPPQRRRVRRAVRRPRLRQADDAVRRGRLSRDGRGARRGPAGGARRSRRPRAAPSASCSATRPSASAWPSAPAPPQPGPTRGTRSPRAPRRSTTRCSPDEGRSSWARTSAPRSARSTGWWSRAWRWWRWWPPSPTPSRATSSGSTSRRGATACR